MLKALRDWFVSLNFGAVLKPLLETENRAVSSQRFFLVTMYCGKRAWNDFLDPVYLSPFRQGCLFFFEGQRKIFRLVGFSRK